MAKIKTAETDNTNTTPGAEVPISTETAATVADATTSSGSGAPAAATPPPIKVRRPFPWTPALHEALLETAINISDGSARGGLTLDSLRSGFASAAATSVTPEDMTLLTPAEVKKMYVSIGRKLAKEMGLEVPELAVTRRPRMDVSRLAVLLKAREVSTGASAAS